MDETWESRALPLLTRLAEQEGIGTVVMIGDLADETGIDADALAIELKRLVEGGYVGGDLGFVMGPLRNGHIAGPVLTERGARAVGLWPSDDPYEAFIALIERQLVDEDDSDTKTKLRKLRDVLGEIGKGTASGLLVALVQASGHLH